MEVNVSGAVGRIVRLANGVFTRVRLTALGSQAVARVEGKYTETGRAGARFFVSPGVVANAVAPVQDLGTTTAGWALYNGNAAGGKSYEVLMAFAYQASGTSGLGAALLLGSSTLVQAAAVAAGTGTLVKAMGSSSGAGANATLGNAITLAGAPAWVCVASNAQPAIVGIGSGPLVANLDGLFIVKPGFALGATVLAPAGTTAKYSVGFICNELDLDME